MSTRIYYDTDADLSIVQNKRLAFIGYGNQGAAQAKNLRDSGVREIITGAAAGRGADKSLCPGRETRDGYLSSYRG